MSFGAFEHRTKGEDSYSVAEINYRDDQKAIFAVVCDGHTTRSVPKTIAEVLPEKVTTKLANTGDTLLSDEQAMKESFLEMDEELLQIDTAATEHGACTRCLSYS
jgi:serine/threonine protein phosphatase PrpC